MNTLRTKLICAGLLAVITLGVYWPVSGFDFINYDDPDYVIYNPMVQQGVTAQTVAWAFTSNHASNWHPLTWISHAMDFGLYGLKPGGHHLTNLLFHMANVVLLFLVLAQLTGATWRSALVAALFAWHPLHVESVAWVSERKDVLSTFFWLLTMAAYGRYAKMSKVQSPRSKVFYGLALLCFALGLLSKPMVVTLPFVLLLLDFWPLNRGLTFQVSSLKPGAEAKGVSMGRLVVEKIPFLILAGLTCAATFWAQRAANSVVSTAALPWPDRVANALVSYVLYLWKTVWPINLAIPYPYSHEWAFGQAAGAGLGLLCVTVAVVWQWRQRPHLAVGWFWFLGTLVPVIGLVQVGIQFMADRYTYVPLIGIFSMVAWSIPAGWARWPRPGFVLGTVGAAGLVVMLCATSLQLIYWRDSVALFRHTTEVTSGNILAEYNLGEALARKGNEEEAVAHYLKALAIRPNRVEAHYNSQPQARFNLSLIYRRHGMWIEAEGQLRACVNEDPSLAPPHNALGSVLLAMGRYDEAAAEFQALVKLEPSDAARANLAQALAHQGKVDAVEQQYRESLRAKPGSTNAP